MQLARPTVPAGGCLQTPGSRQRRHNLIAHRGFRCHAKILLLFLGIAFFRLSSSSSPYHEHTGLYFLAVLCIPHVFLDSWHLVKALYNLRRGETLPPARRLDGLN